MMCGKPGHGRIVAVAALIHPGANRIQSDGLCLECATCADFQCRQMGVVLDEYGDAWCRMHADEFSPEEAAVGPDIVPLKSDRYRELTQESGRAFVPIYTEVSPEAYTAAVRRVGLNGDEAVANRYRNAVDSAAPLIVAAYLEELADTPRNRGPWWALATALRAEARRLRGEK